MMKNDNLSIKVYYRRYCKILNKVITAAKKVSYDNCIKNSYNKLNSTWKIINTETGRTTKLYDTQLLIKKFSGQIVAELINEYFISICNNSIQLIVSIVTHHLLITCYLWNRLLQIIIPKFVMNHPL
jgi:hypothetical protein